MSSHFLDETADISGFVARWRRNRYQPVHETQEQPVIELDVANTELGEASADVTRIAGDLELLPWRIAIGALVLAVVFGVVLLVELL